MTEKQFNKRYKKASPAQRESLWEFRESHPLKSIAYNDENWSYYDSGSGEAILILPGAVGKGEILFHYISNLEKDYRVIVPIYPSVMDVGELTDGINAIMEHEKILSCHVTGFTLGGFFAQAYLLKYSDKVKSLTFIHSATFTDNLDQETIALRKDVFKQRLNHFLFAAMPMLKILIRKQFSQRAEMMRGEEEFWKAYYRELQDDYQRYDAVNPMLWFIDLLEHYRFDSLKNDWDGKTLIIEGEKDAAYEEESKHALRDIFRQAEYHNINNAGHLSFFTNRNEYLKIIRDFLNP